MTPEEEVEIDEEARELACALTLTMMIMAFGRKKVEAGIEPGSLEARIIQQWKDRGIYEMGPE